MRIDWKTAIRGFLIPSSVVAALKESVPGAFGFLVEGYGCTETLVEGPRRGRPACQWAYHNGSVGVVIDWDAVDGLRMYLVPDEGGTLPRDDNGWACIGGAPHLAMLVVLREPSRK